MTITPSFQVWMARLSCAPQLPPRLMIGFVCPQGLDLAPAGAAQATLELTCEGVCLHAMPGVDILFRLARDMRQGADLDDGWVDRAGFLRALMHHRSLTVCAFDDREQAVMALEFNF